MTNTYRATSEYGRAMFGEYEFDADWRPVEERDELDGGHVEIVPRLYTVTSDNYEAGAQGEVVELALPIETEAALIAGGHLERAGADDVEEDEDVEDEQPEVEEPTEEEE